MTILNTRSITSGIGVTAKGSPLTNSELDNNFISLNDNKLEKSSSIVVTTISSATIIVGSGNSIFVGGLTTSPGNAGNSRLWVYAGLTAVNNGATVGYFQTFNDNAAANLKIWRHGGQNDGSYTFQTVNDAYTIATSLVTITATGVLQDAKGDVRAAPLNIRSTSGYTTVSSDAGRTVVVSGNTIIGTSVHSVGDMVTFYNSSTTNIAILSTGLTVYLAGTATTGTRTLAQRGIATILCVSSNTFVISGAGLT